MGTIMILLAFFGFVAFSPSVVNASELAPEELHVGISSYLAFDDLKNWGVASRRHKLRRLLQIQRNRAAFVRDWKSRRREDSETYMSRMNLFWHNLMGQQPGQGRFRRQQSI